MLYSTRWQDNVAGSSIQWAYFSETELLKMQHPDILITGILKQFQKPSMHNPLDVCVSIDRAFH